MGPFWTRFSGPKRYQPCFGRGPVLSGGRCGRIVCDQTVQKVSMLGKRVNVGKTGQFGRIFQKTGPLFADHGQSRASPVLCFGPETTGSFWARCAVAQSQFCHLQDSARNPFSDFFGNFGYFRFWVFQIVYHKIWCNYYVLNIF